MIVVSYLKITLCNINGPLYLPYEQKTMYGSNCSTNNDLVGAKLVPRLASKMRLNSIFSFLASLQKEKPSLRTDSRLFVRISDKMSNIIHKWP